MFNILSAEEEAAAAPAPLPPGSTASPGAPGGAGTSCRPFDEATWSEEEYMSGKLTQGLKWGVIRSAYSLQRHEVCPVIID